MRSPIEYLWYRLFPPSASTERDSRERGKWQGRQRQARRRAYKLNEELVEAVSQLALRDRRNEEDLVNDLVAGGLTRRMENESYEQRWNKLTERQKQIAALLCLKYTYAQISAALGISPATVRSHARAILSTFGLYHKEDLMRALSHWDFSGWSELGKNIE
jgi:DNA-binding CsgD family transcriptional regulator